jgi:hypothetical protein
MRFSNKILVDGTGMLTYYKMWLKESMGPRGNDWTCFWDEAQWYEFSFRYKEDMLMFKLKYGL